MPSIAEQAATTLAAGRSSGTLMSDLPEAIRPQSRAEAEAIQDVLAATQGVYGWKIGPTKQPTDLPLASVLLGGSPTETPGTVSLSALRGAQVELEVAFRFGRDLPVRSEPYTKADVVAAIASAHLAFEIIEARWTDADAISPWTKLADHQSCHGIVVGPALTDWQSLDLSSIELTLDIAGAIQTKPGSASLDDTLGLLTFLANHAAGRGYPLATGQTVITGARLGPTPLTIGQVIGTAGPLGSVELSVQP